MSGKLLLAIVFGAGIFLALAYILLLGGLVPSAPDLTEIPFRHALWDYRCLDVMGQLALLLTGTYGVLVLIKERQ